MRVTIDYEPTAAEATAAIKKAHRAAIRARFSILADHEIAKTDAEIDRLAAQAIAEGKPLELEVARVFTQYGPDALEAAKDA